jgi:hypothetical protein
MALVSRLSKNVCATAHLSIVGHRPFHVAWNTGVDIVRAYLSVTGARCPQLAWNHTCNPHSKNMDAGSVPMSGERAISGHHGGRRNFTCPSAKSLSDEALVTGAKMGRASFFEELHERHREKMFSVASRITRHHGDAQDAVEESFRHSSMNCWPWSSCAKHWEGLAAVVGGRTCAGLSVRPGAGSEIAAARLSIPICIHVTSPAK